MPQPRPRRVPRLDAAPAAENDENTLYSLGACPSNGISHAQDARDYRGAAALRLHRPVA